jgi:hypothetical protein
VSTISKTKHKTTFKPKKKKLLKKIAKSSGENQTIGRTDVPNDITH